MSEHVSAKDYSAFYMPAAIIIAGVLVGAGLLFGLKGNAAPASGGAQPTQAVDIKDVKTDDEPYVGQPNAPVTLAFWSDFQCPYCKAFETGGVPQLNEGPNGIAAAMPDIIKNYVDTGKVKIIFKDFAFLGNDSIDAGEYGRAVWHLYPQQYFAWRTAMYQAQDDEGDQGFGDAASIDALIKSKFPQIDVAAIQADVAANKSTYDAAMQADQQEAASFGISGTPGFITGKTLIPGFSPFSAFKAAIDPQLK
jgi:protein-disulfide isomerase